MLHKAMAAVGVLALVAAGAWAADTDKGPAKKPLGKWERKAGDAEIRFSFKEDGGMHATVSMGDNSVDVDGAYGVTKDGTLFGIITKVEKKGGEGGPSEGTLFSFKFTVDKDKLTLSDFKATEGHDEAKSLIEGDFKKVVD